MSVSRLWLFAMTILLAIFSNAAKAEVYVEPNKRGTLIIVGGGDTPYTIQKRFIELAFDRKQAESEAMDVLLSGFTGYWFLGGDQNLLVASLLGTRALRRIEYRYERGAVVGGTSAGASVMTATMLTGERRAATGRINEEPNAVAMRSTEVAFGFGLLPGAIVDQHFSRRSRDNRLVSAVLDHPQLLGVGIDEETALIVRPDGRWEVLGNGHVKIYDARRAYIVNHDEEAVGASGIRMHVLPRGSRFDPRLGRMGSWRN